MAKIISKTVIVYPPSDGKEERIFICSECRTKSLSPRDKYCSNCGEKIDGYDFKK